MVESRVDHSRVVEIMRRAGQLPLVKDYLLSVQKNNLQVGFAWSLCGSRADLPSLCGAALGR